MENLLSLTLICGVSCFDLHEFLLLNNVSNKMGIIQFTSCDSTVWSSSRSYHEYLCAVLVWRSRIWMNFKLSLTWMYSAIQWLAIFFNSYLIWFVKPRKQLFACVWKQIWVMKIFLCEVEMAGKKIRWEKWNKNESLEARKALSWDKKKEALTGLESGCVTCISGRKMKEWEIMWILKPAMIIMTMKRFKHNKLQLIFCKNSKWKDFCDCEHNVNFYSESHTFELNWIKNIFTYPLSRFPLGSRKERKNLLN